MAKKLGIIELMTKVGEDNVRFQPLPTCLVKIVQKRHDVEVTFATDAITPDEVAEGSSKNTCLIVWMPSDLVNAAVAEHKKKKGGA
jgi:hypothetical protein